nr:MAG TPA: hypothetical protein [Herelleviridae sp.]
MSKKLTQLRFEMEKELKTYPEGSSKYDAIKISSALEVFKEATKKAEKITKKYIPGQEVLTISHEFYDTLQEYYDYLLHNKESIRQSLEEIVDNVKNLEK